MVFLGVSSLGLFASVSASVCRVCVSRSLVAIMVADGTAVVEHAVVAALQQ